MVPLNEQVPYSVAHRFQDVLGAGAGAGAGVGSGAVVVVAAPYSQTLLAPGYGSPKTALLHAMEPVAVRVAHRSPSP
jgi:hypothetical protein